MSINKSIESRPYGRDTSCVARNKKGLGGRKADLEARKTKIAARAPLELLGAHVGTYGFPPAKKCSLHLICLRKRTERKRVYDDSPRDNSPRPDDSRSVAGLKRK